MTRDDLMQQALIDQNRALRKKLEFATCKNSATFSVIQEMSDDDKIAFVHKLYISAFDADMWGYAGGLEYIRPTIKALSELSETQKLDDALDRYLENIDNILSQISRHGNVIDKSRLFGDEPNI